MSRDIIQELRLALGAEILNSQRARRLLSAALREIMALREAAGLHVPPPSRIRTRSEKIDVLFDSFIECVELEEGLRRGALCQRGRKKEISLPRQVLTTVWMEAVNEAPRIVAERLGQDRTSVLYSVKIIPANAPFQKGTGKRLEEYRRMLGGLIEQQKLHNLTQNR